MSIGAATERLATLVAFEIPGKTRILTKEEIAAEYGDRATRPIPPGYRKRINVRARIGIESMNPFVVYRVHETGKRAFMASFRTWEEAEADAGKRRDLMTDEECARDYTYAAIERKRGFHK